MRFQFFPCSFEFAFSFSFASFLSLVVRRGNIHDMDWGRKVGTKGDDNCDKRRCGGRLVGGRGGGCELEGGMLQRR